MGYRFGPIDLEAEAAGRRWAEAGVAEAAAEERRWLALELHPCNVGRYRHAWPSADERYERDWDRMERDERDR